MQIIANHDLDHELCHVEESMTTTEYHIGLINVILCGPIFLFNNDLQFLKSSVDMQIIVPCFTVIMCCVKRINLKCNMCRLSGF